MNKHELYDHLAKTNDPTYNVSKFLEEKAELEELLLKKFNKDKIGDSLDDHIREEIGDLEIRIKILKRVYGKDKVNERIKYKLKKYIEYVKKGLYPGRI